MARSQLKMICPTCKGTGVVPREAGKTVDGLVDAHAIAPLWRKLCEHCNGSGVVMDPGPKSE